MKAVGSSDPALALGLAVEEALENTALEEATSLSLTGHKWLRRLGGALQPARALRQLDLSRCSLVTLEGLEVGRASLPGGLGAPADHVSAP